MLNEFDEYGGTKRSKGLPLPLWHETDMPTALRDVRSQGQSGRHLLPLSISDFVEGFGCRPIAAMRLAPWPASESLQ